MRIIHYFRVITRSGLYKSRKEGGPFDKKGKEEERRSLDRVFFFLLSTHSSRFLCGAELPPLKQLLLELCHFFVIPLLIFAKTIPKLLLQRCCNIQ